MRIKKNKTRKNTKLMPTVRADVTTGPVKWRRRRRGSSISALRSKRFFSLSLIILLSSDIARRAFHHTLRDSINFIQTATLPPPPSPPAVPRASGPAWQTDRPTDRPTHQTLLFVGRRALFCTLSTQKVRREHAAPHKRNTSARERFRPPNAIIIERYPRRRALRSRVYAIYTGRYAPVAKRP